jgi:predicted nucleic acid-binding protein
MARLVFLDSGPLGLISNPKDSEGPRSCRAWLDGLLMNRIEVFIPEIADYEVRRELIRGRKTKGIQRLDLLIENLAYAPIQTLHMRKAAELWAEARQRGFPTAADPALDGDVILAAQALLAGIDGDEVIVATTNPDHLSRFVRTQLWTEIV